MSLNQLYFRFFISVLFVFFISDLMAQGIKGKVTTSDGEPLPFASIYIRNLGDGVPTNQNGEYEFRLKPGYYDVLAQYLGYASVLKTVEIHDDWIDWILK
jgi:hypothetical protein